MSLNSEKSITRRSWGTITMPDAVISHANELSCNKQNKFIFIDQRGHPIGDIKIKVMYRDYAGSNENQAPQDPHHKLHATEEAK